MRDAAKKPLLQGMVPPYPKPDKREATVALDAEADAALEREFNHLLTKLVGSASIAAQRERSWWKRRRLRALTQDLALVANTYAEHLPPGKRGA